MRLIKTDRHPNKWIGLFDEYKIDSLGELITEPRIFDIEANTREEAKVEFNKQSVLNIVKRHNKGEKCDCCIISN